ncbi:hypothetical protein [Streptomyces sp. NPDC002104]
MYAIKVVLQPAEHPSSPGRQSWEAVAGRLQRDDPQPGIEHIAAVLTPPYVVAMTFVVATDLRQAERLTLAAWTSWLALTRLTDWRLVSCACDLYLGVWATRELAIPDNGANSSGGDGTWLP